MDRRSTRAGRLAAGLFLAGAALAAAVPAGAQTADQVGIFFGDPALQVHEGHSEAFPAFDTAYLVLLNPSQPDVGGWECRILVEGPVTVMGWQPVGQAINFATPPEFVVGLGSPLPGGPQVVLASSQLMFTEPGRCRFSLRPVFTPSIAGEMAYIPFVDPNDLTPMRTWTGNPLVATYNDDLPVCAVSSPILSFGIRGLTTVASRSVTITNAGGGHLPVDAELAAPYPPFRIVSGGDPVVLARGEQLTVTLEFQPQEIGEFTQTLDLGTGCDGVLLRGTGREPITELWYSLATVDFSEVLVGATRNRSVEIVNTGEIPVEVAPALADTCEGFSLAPVVAISLIPGATLRLDLVFAPEAAGSYACDLLIGEGLAALPLRGTGYLLPNPDIAITPAVVDFGEVFEGSTHSRTVTVSNEGDTAVALDLSSPTACPAYTIWPLDAGFVLDPDESLEVDIRFQPIDPGSYPCLIGLGEGNPGIEVTGTALAGTGTLRLLPTAVDFGGVALGSRSERTVVVINESAATVEVMPAVDPAGAFSLTGTPAAITLAAGGRHTLTLLFQPGELGPYTGELTLGEGRPTASLAGVGETETTGWLVEPASVDFGSFYVGGSFTDRHVDITNLGNANRQVWITIGMTLDSPYTVLYGGQVWIGPGATHRVLIRFNPNVPGVFATDLQVGDVATVPISGIGVTDVPDCFVHATSLQFGTVLTGTTAVGTVHVTNSGGQAFAIDPATSCDDFLYVGSPRQVEPGETVALQVAFNPTVAGEHACVLDLGLPICDRIIMFGEGSDSLVPDHDLVGVWFDADLTTGIRSDLHIGQAVPAWLVMLNPSEPEGVAGWELRLDLDDGLVLAGWQLAGQAFNIEQEPSFFVGIASPLPYGSQVLLATFDFLVTDTEVHAVDLVPLWRPSIPGGLAYIHGPEFQLKEMYPISGTPSVAWLSADPAVATFAPAPAVMLADGRIELRWPLPADGSDGCHLYRTLGGPEVRLTGAPLRPAADGYRFVDDPAGLPAGATVAYSYAVVRGGTEIARSPAVTVELPGAGAMATRLLPNRPNPFNPETEIHFQLDRAGRVRLAVFDVSGRRVAVLADGPRGAGSHHVAWRGRDQAGRAVPSGAYYVRLETDGGVDTRKIMLLK